MLLKIQHVVSIFLFILFTFDSHFVYFVYSYIETNTTSYILTIQMSATGKKDL